ncbi:MAG: MurR/RpiR family transcriptional regulator, partial [Oscillibacter sp.]|nr:MurR/RpiR family transcriptional regulator [Oscillibacter sp.]
MDIFARLRDKGGFTDTESKIADYVLEHRCRIRGMSAEALAKVTFSSKASIIRLCRKVGLSGYREFQIAVAAQEYRDALREDTRDFAGAIRAAADDCARYISEESLRRAAVWIARARRVYVYAADLSTAVAVRRMLSGLGVASAVCRKLSGSPGNPQGDVALVLSHSGSAAHALRGDLDALRRRACRVILIAPACAATEADIVIAIPEPATGADMLYTQTG